MDEAQPDEIAARLAAAIPEGLPRTVEAVGSELVSIDVPGQEALGGTMTICWLVADGWQFNIFAPLLIYEDWFDRPVTIEETERFATLIEDLFAGRIEIEIWRFQNGQHWRTRLIDPRRLADDQIVQVYHRRALRLFRRVTVSRVKLASA